MKDKNIEEGRKRKVKNEIQKETKNKRKGYKELLKIKKKL